MRIILEWILRIEVGKVRTGFIGLGYGPVAVSCEHRNEASGSLRTGEFID
jgi:hypothetical protein